MQRTDIFSSQNGPSYVRFTLSFTDLTAAAASQAVALLANPIPGVPPGVGSVLFQIPAHGKVTGVSIEPTQSFRGGSISAMTVSLGTNASPTLFASAFDVYQAPGDTVLQESGEFQSGSRSAQAVIATFTATGDNVNKVTQGFVEIYIYFLNVQAAVN